MARPSSRFPTELELMILGLIWDHGSQPVRSIRDRLASEAQRELAHTSVVTTLNKMVEKGYLKRRQDGNAYIFDAAVERDFISSGMLDDVLQRVFRGSAKSMVLSLLKNEKLSAEEHQELRDLIAEDTDSEETN